MSDEVGYTQGVRIAASALVRNGPIMLTGMTFESDGSGAGYVKVYDAATAAGDPVYHIVIPNDAAFRHSVSFRLHLGTGCYVAVSKAVAVVLYS